MVRTPGCCCHGCYYRESEANLRPRRGTGTARGPSSLRHCFASAASHAWGETGAKECFPRQLKPCSTQAAAYYWLNCI